MNRLKRLRAASSSGSKDREPRRDLGNPLSVSTSSLNSLKKEQQSIPNGRTQRSTDDIVNNNNEEPSSPLTPTVIEKVEGQMKESHSLPLRSQICAKCGSASSLQSFGQTSSISKSTIDSDSMEIRTGTLPRSRTAVTSKTACNSCSKTGNSAVDDGNKGATGRTRSLKWNKAARGLYRKLRKGYSCDAISSSNVSSSTGSSTSRSRIFRRQTHTSGDKSLNGANVCYFLNSLFTVYPGWIWLFIVISISEL